ncbi:MAG: hypothetical protein JSR66_10615 [Proteobacteria bacterium]|nr:hypothetical protein [Pseudomonadota bacterium]
MSKTIWLRAVVSAFVASWVAGCATDRLDAAPPSGVNLTGDWKLNLNLSDDPDKMAPDPDTTAPKRAPGSHRGHGGGRGGAGMPPIGTPPDGGMPLDDGPTASTDGPSNGRISGGDNKVASVGAGSISADGIRDAGYSFVRVGLAQSQDGPAQPDSRSTSSGQSPGAPNAKPSRGTSIARYLRAPLTLSITQDKGSLTVKSNMPDGTQTSDTYTPGTKTTIPFGQDQTAERTAGWRGTVFVVTTSAKKFGSREDEYAIDTEDGRLIMTTLTRGGRMGKVEITRVYDRVKP